MSQPHGGVAWERARAALEARLSAGIDALGLTMPAAGRGALLDYLGLLNKWGGVYNLTAVSEPAEMVPRHLLDSLAVAPFLEGERMLDVGTGAGLPGIPLAVLFPHREFVLLDSRGKKTRFVRQAVTELALRNVTVVKSRVEDFVPKTHFDTVVARAVGGLEQLIRQAERLCGPRGRLLCMKGQAPLTKAEIERLNADDRDRLAVKPLRVPFLNAHRHVILVTVEGRASIAHG